MKVKKIVNFTFRNSLTPLINKHTRVARTNATVIDHLFTNAFLNKQIETGIIRNEIFDHFPTFLITDPTTSSEINNKRIILYKRTINTVTKENFKNILMKKTRSISNKVKILMKPIAHFYLIFPYFVRKLFQN